MNEQQQQGNNVIVPLTVTQFWVLVAICFYYVCQLGGVCLVTLRFTYIQSATKRYLILLDLFLKLLVLHAH